MQKTKKLKHWIRGISLLILMNSCFLLVGDNTPNSLILKDTDKSFLNGKYELASYIYVLPDPSGSLSLEETQSQEVQKKFSILEDGALLEIQNHTRYFWLKFTITSQLTHQLDWLLHLGFPEVQIYIPENSTYRKIVTGTHQKNISPILNYSYLPLTPISIEKGTSKTFYVRVQSIFNFHLVSEHLLSNQLVLINPRKEMDTGLFNQIVFGLSSGIFLIVIFYHFLLFFFNQDKSYLAIAGFCFSLLLVGLHINKSLITWLQISNTGWVYDIDFLVMLSLVTTVVFLLRAIYPLSQRLSFLDKSLTFLLYIQIGITILFSILYFIDKTIFYDWTYQYGNLFFGILPMLICIIAVGIVLFFVSQKTPYASLFALAIGIPLFDGILACFGSLLEIRFLPRYYSFISFEYIISAIILSIALAKRRREIEREKESIKISMELKEKETIHLKELDDLKTNFFTDVTHQLLTPLTIIKGYVEEMPRKTKGKNLIVQNTDKILRMINEILILSKLKSHKEAPKYIQSDIISFIGYQVNTFQSIAANKSVELYFFSQLKKLIIDFDPEKLEIILRNLISNAIKYTSNGKVQVSVEIQQENIQFIITDTGIGIPKEEIPNIFNRFYQLNGSSTKMRAGYGLGLALVKELTEVLNGTINVSSTIDRGSTFSLLLPIHRKASIKNWDSRSMMPNENSSKKQTKLPTQLSSYNRLKILLIEDNTDVVIYLQSILPKQFHVHTSFNGTEGIIVAKETIPDIIICDIMMPGTNGIEVCKILKAYKTTSHIPIIFLTAKVALEDRIKGLSAGADAYLTKPFNKQELLLTIENLIQLRKSINKKYTIEQESSLQNKDAVSTKDQILLQKIKAYIIKNINNTNIRTHHLQKATGLSRTHLHVKIKALTGISTSQFVKNIRLSEAKKLLEGKLNLTISEIAYQVGFEYPNHFSNDFKKMYGISPSEILKRKSSST